jgi:hypothetical protein
VLCFIVGYRKMIRHPTFSQYQLNLYRKKRINREEGRQQIKRKYRVIKKSLCTRWLQYRKLQVMFKVSPASLQIFINTRLTLTPSVIPNSNYDIMVSDWNCLKYFFLFLYCNYQVHIDILKTLYFFRWKRKIQVLIFSPAYCWPPVSDIASSVNFVILF